MGKLLFELSRIKKIMGLTTLNENYYQLLKKLLGLSDEGANIVSKTADDVSSEFSSGVKQIIGGSGSYNDLLTYITKQGGGNTIDSLVTFIQSKPDLLKAIATSSDMIMKDAANKIIRNSDIKKLLTQTTIDIVDDLLTIPIRQNNANAIIPMIDDAITTLSRYQSNLDIADLIKKLDDRKNIANNIKSTNNTNLLNKTNIFTPSSVASSFLENFAYTNKSFIQMISGKPMSGWKIHVYGDDIEDSVYLITKLDDFLKSQNASYKIATDKFYKNSKNTIQQGKGLTIYIPYDIVKQGKQKIFFDEINSKISDYKKSGTIQGDKAYNDKIHYRYEYNKPFDALPEGGVSINDASKYYVDNQGDYMSGTGNLQPDLFNRISTDSTIKTTQNLLTGNRISNRSFSNGENINWDKITNAKNIEDYNKIIAKAIQTGDYSTISRGGFENYGVNNFREYLINNIEKINDIDSSTGRWSVTFK